MTLHERLLNLDLPPFDKQLYCERHPRCEVERLLPCGVRQECIDQFRHSPFSTKLDLAHVLRGHSRVWHEWSVLHVLRPYHVWCDSNGAAGQVVLYAAKLGTVPTALHGDVWRFWAEVRRDNPRGCLESDKAVQQCVEVGGWCERLRQEMVCLTNDTRGHT